MAKTSAEANPAQQQADEYREILANAYAFVEGAKSAKSFTALTPEDLMDRFIERIEGKDTQARPNILNRLAKIKHELESAVEKIKAMPPEAFRRADPAKDVNTPVEETDTQNT